ncbi:ParB/RepB/Spo0J family partition protein [Burkholderia sp. MR1-5-21]
MADKRSRILAAFDRKPDTPSVSEQNSPLSKARNKFDIANEVAQATEDSPPHSAPVVSLNRAHEVRAALSDDLSPEFRAWCIATGYVPGQTIEIELTAVKDSPYNPRHFYPQKTLESLTANLAEQGQQTPIHVIPDYQNPGAFIISDGGRRTRSLRALKITTVRAIVVDLPIGIQSYKMGFDLNTQRESQTPFDNAVKWRRMLDDRLFATQRELGEVLGINEGTIAQTLALAKLPEELLMEMVVTSEYFGLRLAYEVVRYYDKTDEDLGRTLELVRKIVREELSLRDVQRVIAKDVGTPTRKLRGQRAVFNHRIEYKLPSGEVAGELKTYGEDRLDLQLKGLTPDLRAALQRKIEEVLQPLRGAPTDADTTVG